MVKKGGLKKKKPGVRKGKAIGKVNVPKGSFAYVKNGTVFAFKPKRRSK
ncbi:MAG: hypothetical protein ACYCSO_05145 [Cuniculiplasma sp.]